jgi:hypothetical protein
MEATPLTGEIVAHGDAMLDDEAEAAPDAAAPSTQVASPPLARLGEKGRLSPRVG